MAEPPSEQRGHHFLETTATDNARVHNGDQHHRYERVDAVYYGDVARTTTPISRGGVLSLTRRITESKNGEDLIDAASKGQIERMNRILSEKYTNIDFMNRSKKTALLAAIEHGQLAAVTTLLKRGVNPGLRYNKRHKSPLALAAEMGRFAIFSALLQNGAPMDGLQIGRRQDPGEEWWCPYREDGLWLYRFDKELYCHSVDGGITDVLAIAISHSKPAIVIELLKHGLHAHKEAIIAAIALDDKEIIQSLAAAGADAEILYQSSHDPSEHYRPLHLAAFAGMINSIHGLITAGVDVEARGPHQYTPLHCAAKTNHEEAVRVLLAAGAIIEARGAYEGAPLMAAALKNSPEALQVLLAAGADREARNDYGVTALHCAASTDAENSIRNLIAAGADVEARNKNMLTPLHYAAINGSENAIQVLLAAGAGIEARDKSGRTPLHNSAICLNIEGTQALLAAGANASVVDNKGKTLYDLALSEEVPKWVVDSAQDREKILAVLKKHMEHDDFDSRSFITARTRQNLEADETATIRPGSDDEDEPGWGSMFD